MKPRVSLILLLPCLMLLLAGCRRDPLSQGIKAITQGNYPQAETLFKRVLEQNPDDASAVMNLGIIHLKKGNPDAALTAFLKTANLTATEARPLEYAGAILMDRGQWREALDLMVEAARRAPHSERVQTALAMAELHTLGAPAAAARLTQVVANAPNYGPALFNLAVINRDWLKNPAETRKYFQRYLVVGGDAPHVAIARASVSVRRTPAAPASSPAATTTAAVAPAARPGPTPPPAARNPQGAASAFAAGIAHHQAGELDKAAREYGRALQDDPAMMRAHYNLGLILRAQGNLAGARSAFEEAVAGAPGMSDARYMLALVLIDQNDTPAAMAQLGALLEKMPNHADAHLALGLLYKSDPAKLALARQELALYLKLAPDGKAAREVKNWLKYQH